MRVAVVGGGITGLVAARELERLGASVTLFESDERLGGKIETLQIRGVPVEAGPDWFLTRNPAALDLVKELGLEGELVEPARSGASILRDDQLVELPPDQVRGVPLHPFNAVRAGLLTRGEGLRAMADVVMPGRVSGADVSVGELVRKRLGPAVLERMVDPMLAASRAGRATDLSLEAAAPEVDEVARKGASLIRGLRARASEAKRPSVPPFLGLKSGMGSLVDRLVADLATVQVHSDTEVQKIERRGELLVLDEVNEFDRVVLALPSHAAARTLQEQAPGSAALLGTIRYSSAVVAVLVFEKGTIPEPPRGSGFLVPTVEGKAVTAGAWYSLKWEHSRPEDGGTFVRCFAGRARNDPIIDVDSIPDEELQSRLVQEVTEITNATRPPAEIILKRWPAALPQYEVGHNARVQQIETSLATELPGVVVAGAGYRGSGLPDCITQAQRVAKWLVGG